MPIDKQVETMAFHGVPVEQIALSLGIDTNRYTASIARGRVKAQILASELTLTLALQGDTNAALNWSRSQSGGVVINFNDAGVSKEEADAIIDAADY